MEKDSLIYFSGQTEDGAPDQRQNTIKPPPSGTDPISVLIIEDESAHYQLMERAILKGLPGASVNHSASAAACLAKLGSINPDVMLVDYLLPGMTGIDFLTALKRTGCDIPVIMITGQGDEKIAVQAMKLGAKDYLVKSADFFLLLPAVIAQVARERRLQLNLRKGARLNAILLDSLPYPAMMISQDRLVLAANRIAQEMGARVGNCCFRSFRHGAPSDHHPEANSECPFCRVTEAFKRAQAVNSPEMPVHRRVWDIWWIPLDSEVCLTYAIDITERKRAEDTLRASSRFLEIVHRHTETRSLLQNVVDELRKVTGCCAAAVWLSREAAGAPILVSEGYDPGILGPDAMPLIDRRASAVRNQTQNTTGHAPAVGNSPPFLSADASPAPPEKADTNMDGQPAYPSAALLPICLNQRILGSIYLADTREGMLPPETIEIVNRAAMNLASALERIFSKEQLKKSEQTLRILSDRLMTAQEEERTRISRELHDSIGSSLCTIRLSIQNVLQGKLGYESLEKAVDLTQSTIDEVRRIMTDLRPSILDELGILAALRWFCRQFRELHPEIEVIQQIGIGEHEVPEPLKIVILRIVQESFNNITKYSRADTVTLGLRKKGHAIQLSVNDNGIGFVPDSSTASQSHGTGIGLVSMKERAELSGGIFSLKSAKGQGTMVMAAWPISGGARGAQAAARSTREES